MHLASANTYPRIQDVHALESSILQALQLFAQRKQEPLIRFDVLSHEIQIVEFIHVRHLVLQRRH